MLPVPLIPMKPKILLLALMALCGSSVSAEQLVYHEIQTDRDSQIIPWSSPEPAKAYDQVIRAVWSFLKNMGTAPMACPTSSSIRFGNPSTTYADSAAINSPWRFRH